MGDCWHRLLPRSWPVTKQKVAIKNLTGRMVYENRMRTGAAILGEDRVGLILDVNAREHLDTQTPAGMN